MHVLSLNRIKHGNLREFLLTDMLKQTLTQRVQRMMNIFITLTIDTTLVHHFVSIFLL